MEYRIEELARMSGVGVDTIRYYQNINILHKPRRKGRCVYYGHSHIDRLKLIRKLSKQGFSLALIKRTLSMEKTIVDLSSKNLSDLKLLSTLVQEGLGNKSYSRSELTSETGIPESLISLARSYGLFGPTHIDGDEKYSQADIQMLKAGFAILEAGFPLDALLAIGKQHATNIESTADKAIDLFNYYLRKGGPSGKKASDTAAMFKQLLPQITRLVAIHFQRTLINRALLKVTEKHISKDSLSSIVNELQSAHLEIKWQ